MSESTIARLKGDEGGFIHPRVIENFINSNPDKFFGYRADASRVKRENIERIEKALEKGYTQYGDSSEDYWYDVAGSIILSKEGKDGRYLFYSYHNVRCEEDKLHVAGEGVVISNFTYLSLGCDDEAKHIMIQLLTQFGGWYEENDCADDINLIPYKGSPDSGYAPPRFVTLQDVYEKFGEYVIIQDFM